MTNGISDELMAIRVAGELEEGMYVNLGMGLPTLVSNFVPADREIIFHSQNGVLGYGHVATEAELVPDVVNAGGQPVTLKPWAAFVHHADSFALIRGRHLDCAILGAFQVSEEGDLANWAFSEAMAGAVGGAMDLAAGARRIIAMMKHVTRSGEPRVVRRCTYPLTAPRAVDLIVTDLAVIEVTPEGLLLREVAPGVSAEEVQALTEPTLRLSPQLREMQL